MCVGGVGGGADSEGNDLTVNAGLGVGILTDRTFAGVWISLHRADVEFVVF